MRGGGAGVRGYAGGLHGACLFGVWEDSFARGAGQSGCVGAACRAAAGNDAGAGGAGLFRAQEPGDGVAGA